MSRPSRARALTALVGIAALTLSVGWGASAGANVAPRTTKQLGFNSFVQDTCQSNAVWAADATGQFNKFKSLGGNSVALAFPIYMASLHANSVYTRKVCHTSYVTPTPARLAVAIKTAHNLHMKVLLRPLVDEVALQSQGGWRGVIKPTSVNAWFKSYLAVLTPYLKLAAQDKVESFAISTELDSLATKSNWKALIASAKHIYHGSLIFTIDWGQNAIGKVKVAGTFAGMDAYEPAALPTTATPSELLTAWNNAIAHTNTVPFALSSAAIDEVVILAQDGAYATPYSWSLPMATHPFNPTIQANWYSMVCSFFKTHQMTGLYFWGIWYAQGAKSILTTPNPNLPQNMQPQSAAVIKNCYTTP